MKYRATFPSGGRVEIDAESFRLVPAGELLLPAVFARCGAFVAFGPKALVHELHPDLGARVVYDGRATGRPHAPG